uniref:Uncharacterized protein n=1 Tax=Tanacetum cinerariifolium TaxID=118510 RepID=A0A6L2LLA7_TANCI|nr:hypothetical protein [Tanacetum cinerariifolium]
MSRYVVVDSVIMVKMVSYEAFACPCGDGDVVLRESYEPKTCGKPYYACRRSKVKNHMIIIESNLFSRSFNDSNLFSRSSSTPIYSPGASKNAECSNCKHLLDKITILEATVEFKNPKQHTLNSAALLHEVYNDMGKLDLE